MLELISIEERLAEYLDTPGSDLPIFDRTALLVQQEARQSDPDAHKILNLVGKDQALVAEVLRTANSSFYSGIKKVVKIQDAAVRIGLRETVNCVMMATQRRNYSANNAFMQPYLGDMWRHSVACGSAAQWLARRCGMEELGPEAFLAGLIHDIGKLLVLRVLAEVQGKDRSVPHMPRVVVEEFLTALHGAWGSKLVSTWNLPGVFGEICRDHHAEICPEGRTLLIMVRLANLACHKLGIGLIEDRGIVLAATREAQLLRLGDIALAELEIAVEDYMLRGD